MAPLPEKPEIASIARDPLIPQWQGTLDPQDETLRQRGGGKGIALYDEIRRDPHAFAILQKRSLEVASREWRVEAASEKRIDRKAAEEVERQLKGINFDRLTLGLMSAVLKGFAVAEVMWEVRDGTWTAARVKVRKQRRFRMTVEGDLRLLTRESTMDGIELPPRKFIVHRFSVDHDDDDPYGLGLGTVLFWPAWFKRQVLAFWLRGAERFASPTMKATYQGEYDEAKQNQLLAAIRSAASDAGVALPEGVVLELLESTRAGGADAYEKLSRYLDELMSEAVLGETLSTNSGERGARSLGEVHDGVRIAIAKADADLVCATVRETLVTWITELNYPGATPPSVWRDFEEPEDLDKRADRDTKIKALGFRPKDVGYVNDTYGLDWVEAEPPPEPGPPAAGGPSSRLDALFAEALQPEAAPQDPIAERLADEAAPALAALLAPIRDMVNASTSYADFAERLLSAYPQMDVSRLGEVMEQAIRIASLAGMASAVDEAADGER